MDNGDTISISMWECASASDTRTQLSTKGLGPCAGIALVINDIQNTVHRFLAHLPYAHGIGDRMEFETFCEKLKSFLASIENMQSIEGRLVTSYGFHGPEYLAPEERHFIKKLDKMLDKYRKLVGAKNFSFPVYKSSAVSISPSGNFIIPQLVNDEAIEK